MGKAWQQKNIKITYHCKNQVQKLKVKIQKEDLGWNTTWLSVCLQTQQDCVCVHKHNTRSIKILYSKSLYMLVKTKTI